MEYIDKPDGGKAFVFYCLGNLISAQSSNLSMVGMLGYLTITKDLTNNDLVAEVKYRVNNLDIDYLLSSRTT